MRVTQIVTTLRIIVNRIRVPEEQRLCFGERTLASLAEPGHNLGEKPIEKCVIPSRQSAGAGI